MADPTCYSSLQACLIRLSKLDASGAPLAGAANGYASTAVIDLTVAVEIEEGDEFTLRNACGEICATFKDVDRIKRLNLSLNLCQLDFYLIEFLTDADLFESGGVPVGFQYPSVSAAAPNGVCFEIWTKAWDGTEQATPTFTTPDVAYDHWVFPRTKWVMGDLTMENDLMVVPVEGTSEENSNITANGPFNDWPAAVAGAGGVTRVGGVFYDSKTAFDTAATEADCTTQTVAAGSA